MMTKTDLHGCTLRHRVIKDGWRSATWLGREGKITIRVVKGVRGDVAAHRVYIAGGEGTRKAEIALVQGFPCHERKVHRAFHLRRQRKWMYLWQETDWSQIRERKDRCLPFDGHDGSLNSTSRLSG